MTRHLTYTGANAGTYLCLRYRQQLGGPARGTRHPDDTSAHYAYAPAWMLTDPATCADCQHVAGCRAAADCRRCRDLGYQDEPPIDTPAAAAMRTACPDCHAEPGEPCSYNCSSNWK